MVLNSLKSCALRCKALVCNITKGDNVKIYMQMMDLENLEKVFFSLKKLIPPRCKFLRNCI